MAAVLLKAGPPEPLSTAEAVIAVSLVLATVLLAPLIAIVRQRLRWR